MYAQCCDLLCHLSVIEVRQPPNHPLRKATHGRSGLKRHSSIYIGSRFDASDRVFFNTNERRSRTDGRRTGRIRHASHGSAATLPDHETGRCCPPPSSDGIKRAGRSAAVKMPEDCRPFSPRCVAPRRSRQVGRSEAHALGGTDPRKGAGRRSRVLTRRAGRMVRKR